MSFVHLHLHSEYSLLDSSCRIKQLVSRAKELGQTAVAVTDNGNMYAAVEFYNEALAQGIKPIIGCELFGLALLCKDNIGYQNLIKLVSQGAAELLDRYSGGLIALSGGSGGEIYRLLSRGEYHGAKTAALRYLDIFGKGNFYLEVQNHGTREELSLLPLFYRLSAETGIPIAAANDVHYIRKQDSSVQRVLYAIGTGTRLDDKSAGGLPTEEYYMKSEEEMRELFAGVPHAVENTAKIADMCTVTFEFGKIKLPRFTKEGVTDTVSYFKKLCRAGMKKRYGDDPPEEYWERMNYELDVVIKMGYTDYYLIVWDFIRYARENGIPVGPGRGSGAGSILAYCIGITSIDPMRYGLLFERFLNPERVTMPDFDIDFCYEGRQRVIDYVIKKYGTDRVAQIITFGTMAAKAAIRDAARVMGIPQTGDRAARLIPFGPHVTLDGTLRDNEDFKRLYDTDRETHALVDIARKIEGMPRHASTHAAGVVICDAPVSDYVPVQKNGDVTVTQYTMTVLESLGLLKMDFLGLRNLTVIRDAVRFIQRTEPQFDINKIPLDDPAVYDMISAGQTTGVFQFESGGMRQVLMRLVPENIEDLIAVLSLYRPGPMDSIPRYIECRHNPQAVTYKHPILKDILDVTYGCIVYQEQVMEICRKMAGYSYGRADLVRRAMAKKKSDVMMKERDVFVEGAKKNGVPEQTANEVFDEMSSFASYAFNKSHAAAYAHISYQTAYLKCHYFTQYMAALMTAFSESAWKFSEYSADCARCGVKILTPDINESEAGFTPSEKGIRFALLAVKGLGYSSIRDITEERRRGGSFASLRDFRTRMSGKDLNKTAMESLIKCGAFDRFGYTRQELLLNFDRLFGGMQSPRGTVEGQISFFGSEGSEELPIERCGEFPLLQKLEMEKEVVGAYLSGHPLQDYEPLSRLRGMNTVSRLYDELRPIRDGAAFSMFCTVRHIRQYTQKNGGKMAFAVLEDMTGEAEGIAFADVYASSRDCAVTGKAVYIEAKASYKDGEPKLLLSLMTPAEKYAEFLRKMTLYIRISSSDGERLRRCAEICGRHGGDTRVLFYLADVKKKLSPKNIPGVSLSASLVSELSEAAGLENIALK